ncbi:MAG: DivIVA domain-containing protein [Armatimonadota bacterium]|jgi:cell division initiation protein|nr:hypothetical protein [Armatimonadota bacterium]
MQVKPIDILNKKFAHRMRGYDTSEVDEFMKEAADAFEVVLSENARLKERIESINLEVNRYKNLEATLNSTLVMAQKNADDMRTNAANEAERVVRDAKEQMNRELADARRELEDLRNTRLRFQTELRSLLNSYLAMSEGEKLGGGTGEFTEE